MNTAIKKQSFVARFASSFKEAFRIWAITPNPFYGNPHWSHFTHTLR